MKIAFYNATYKKRVSVWLDNKDTDGKLHGTISIDQYGRPGEYVVEEIEVSDKAENERGYGEFYGKPIPDAIKNMTFVVYNAGAGADLIVSTNTSDIVKQIATQKDDAVILVDYSNKSTINSDVFDAIKGTDRTLVLESEGVQWIFNGNDMTKDSKKIDLSVDVAYVSEVADGSDKSAITNVVKKQPTVVLSFPENGVLPGTAKMRIKADYSMKKYLGQSGIYIYYVDNANGKMVPVAQNLSVTADSYIEFDITHCSKYIMVKGALANLNISTKSNSTGKNATVSGSTGTASSGSKGTTGSSSGGSSASSGYTKGDVKSAGKGAAKAEYKKISSTAVRYEKTGVGDKTTKAVVPATVKIGGKTYKVTSIAPKAFANQKKLKSLTIGKNVKKIGSEALSGCTKLKSLTINAKGLKKKNVKDSLKGSAVNTLKVPAKKADAYKNIFKKANSGKKVKVTAK